jgi:rhamnosyltransferase subunit B
VPHPIDTPPNPLQARRFIEETTASDRPRTERSAIVLAVRTWICAQMRVSSCSDGASGLRRPLGQGAAEASHREFLAEVDESPDDVVRLHPMAHFLLTPVGSSGDVHPFVGIGRALRARGHDVTLLTAEPFRAVSQRAGLRFVRTHSEEEFDRLTKHPDLWHSRKGLTLVLRSVASVMRADYARIVDTYEPGRTVLVGHALSFATRVFEEVHGAPAATVHLAPSIFRSDHQQPAAMPGVDPSGLPVWLKRSTWWLVDRWLLDRAVVPELNRWRRELGLEPVSRVFKDWLHAPRMVIGLFPAWFAPVEPDWPPQLRLTGFPLYDESDAHVLSPDLQAFLGRGSPPILFTPGSANRAAAQFFAAAVDATRRLGHRALFLTQYPEQLPATLGSDVRHEPYAPFSQVLPRCAAFVHHGGIGTCAQGLAAGVPQLTMPLGFDQPDNTTRLWRLGVARWVLPRQFSGERVAAELAALLGDSRVAERGAHWAQELRRSDPLVETCAMLEALIP